MLHLITKKQLNNTHNLACSTIRNELHTLNGHTTSRFSYLNGILHLFGIMVSWRSHQTNDQTFKLPRQLIFKVIN